MLWGLSGSRRAAKGGDVGPQAAIPAGRSVTSGPERERGLAGGTEGTGRSRRRFQAGGGTGSGPLGGSPVGRSARRRASGSDAAGSVWPAPAASRGAWREGRPGRGADDWKPGAEAHEFA